MRAPLWAVLLIGAGAGCGQRPLEPRDPTPGVPHFRVATFNVHYPTQADPATLGAVDATGADVVFLQEADASWRAALAERFADTYPHQRYTVGEGPRGLAVLSRFPIEQYADLPAPNDWHPAARVVLRTPAGALEVLHVHLRSRFEGRSNPLTNFIDTFQDHVLELQAFMPARRKLPQLVVGDFNEEPDGAALDWLEQRGFRNVLPLYHPGQGTWAGRSIAGQLSLTIDHVLFDPSLVPLDARVGEQGSSDHAPVVAHLEAAWPQDGGDHQN